VTEQASTGTGQHGTLESVDGRSVIRFERYLRHPIDTVWQVVTEPEHLKAWFPSTIDGERRAGAPLHFRFVDVTGVDPIDGVMLAYDPPHTLAFMWGPDEIRIELVADGEGTRIVLTDVVDEHGKAARDAAGWHGCLDALELHADGRTDRAVMDGRWSEVQSYYVDTFGPEAATIGPPEGMERRD
jgi:uncharacterized protein YndB with AHSA1/START domain